MEIGHFLFDNNKLIPHDILFFLKLINFSLFLFNHMIIAILTHHSFLYF